MSTYTELLNEKIVFNENIDKQIEIARKEESAIELEKIKQAISVFGFNATELGLKKSPIKKTPAVKSPPIYKDGNGNTYTGRGAPPAWVSKIYESAGSDKEKRKAALEKYRIAQ